MDIGIFVASMSIIMSTGNIFLYCFVGSFTTENFWRYADASYETLWYKFPVNLQKYLRMIIANAHRPRIFNGLGIINLSLMSFMMVHMLYLYNVQAVAVTCRLKTFRFR